MKNKYLTLIIIVVISIFSIVSIVGLNNIDSLISGSLFKTIPTTDLPLKNETFDGVKISVPADATFKNTTIQNLTYPQSFEAKEYPIYIDTYITNLTKKNIDYIIPSSIEANNLTEINLSGLSKNAKAYLNPAYNDTIIIIIINDKENKAVHLMVDGNEKFAVKMANSVVFPN